MRWNIISEFLFTSLESVQKLESLDNSDFDSIGKSLLLIYTQELLYMYTYGRIF